jgi:hypothetical protein
LGFALPFPPLLVEAVRTVDLLDRLDTEVRRDGPTIDSPQGLRAHPAAVEARQQRIALARADQRAAAARRRRRCRAGHRPPAAALVGSIPTGGSTTAAPSTRTGPLSRSRPVRP